MARTLGFLGELLKNVGGSCMGFGGFETDERGYLVEVYEDDEDWPEEIYSGDESQDGEDFGWSDCVWHCAERNRT